MKKLIAVQLEDQQLQKIEQLVRATGWNQSELIRRLIDNAWVKPAAIGTELAPKAVALAVDGL
jgi:Arc/MetJ-type ribon-helix-helix transcriptional regulator